MYNSFKYNNLESKIMAYEHLKDKDVKAWLMEMPQEKINQRRTSWEKLDEMVVELLKDKGVRLTKQSAITPKGIFKVHKKNNNLFQKAMDKAREKFAANKAGPRNEFFEMKYNYEEIRDLYNKIGGLQNTFPIYMKTKEDYENYAQTHDIWIIEDTKTNEPIGFFSHALFEQGSADHKELEEDFGVKIDKPVLYYDTLAIDNSRIGENLGKMISDITDSYYFNLFNNSKDKTYTPILVTGEINQVKGMDLSRLDHIGKLSRTVHSKRGFEVIGETSSKAAKYLERDAYYQEEDKKHNLSVPGRSFFMKSSYSQGA